MVNLDYLYNPVAVKNLFDKNYFVDKELSFSVIKHGTILPHKDVYVDGKWTWGKGGIIDSDGKFIKSSHVKSNVGEGYNPALKSIQHSSETVIYLGLFYPVWGHVITDNIRRLWFLKSKVFKKDFRNYPLVYCSWGGKILSSDNQKNFKRLLEILEVDVNRLQPITQPTQFENIILPDESFVYGETFTKEYQETIDHIRGFALKNRTPTSYKKIYYFYGRKQFGEERLAKYFYSKGYAIVQPEFLTLDEQLNLLINCECFASTIGSSSHNSIFLRDDVELVLIPRSANAFTLYQQAINQVHPINANYIDSSISVFNERHDFFCFIISEQLKRFFGDKFDGYSVEDFKIFMEYVKEAARRNRDASPKEVSGYGNFLQDFLAQLCKFKKF